MKNILQICFLFYLQVILFMLLIVLSAITSKGQLMNNSNVAITIQNGIQLTVQGVVINTGTTSVANDGIIDLTGDFTNNANNNCFGTSQGTVILNGGNQNIGGVTVTDFNMLTLSGTGTKTLQQNISVGGNYISPTGVLDINSHNFDLNANQLSITNNLSNAISRTTGFIISETNSLTGYGIIKWNINSTGVYEFPFGSSLSNSYLPVQINVTNAGAGNGFISLATYPTLTSNTPNNRPLPLGVNTLSNPMGNENAENTIDRFWITDEGNFSVNPVFDFTMTYLENEWDASNSSSNNINESSLRAQRWDGAQWQLPQTGNINTTGNTMMVGGVTNFQNSAWTFATMQSPLPIELLSFTAKLNSQNKTDLNWTTITETNNDFFTIEKTKNGFQFESMTIVDGAGNSNSILNYYTLDEHPYEGITYYRLKQTDFNGQSSYSGIQSVVVHSKNQQVVVYPNPAHDQLNISFESENFTATIYDMAGRKLFESNNQKQLNLEALASGVYTVMITDGTTTFQKKFVKE